jgi:flagellar biosynthesis protein FliQ
MMIDKHTIALISIIGCSLDVLGALYLAYDLLGGEHGPLRTLTRAITYGALFGVGFGLGLGVIFGLAAGATTGVTLAWEFSRAAKQRPKPGFWYDVAMSAIRAAGYALGTSYFYGVRFGIVFGILAVFGQILAYRIGIRPTLDYQPVARPRLTRNQVLSAIKMTIGYVVAGYLSALAAGQRTNSFSIALKVGLLMGLVIAVLTAFTSFIEWGSDHVPEKSMGVFGVALILVGFALQSFQYWSALFDWTAP